MKSTGPAPGKDNWAINGRVEYLFPGTAFTEGKEVKVTWYDGDTRPPANCPISPAASGPSKAVFIGTEGVLLCGMAAVLHLSAEKA